MKKILDACCGGRAFWFDKENPDEDCFKPKLETITSEGEASNSTDLLSVNRGEASPPLVGSTAELLNELLTKFGIASFDCGAISATSDGNHKILFVKTAALKQKIIDLFKLANR